MDRGTFSGAIQLEPFHSQEWSISNFPRSLTRNITSHSMENLAFHSPLRRKMIILPILTTSPIHFSCKRLGECTFWTYGSGRVKQTRWWDSEYGRYSWHVLTAIIKCVHDTRTLQARFVIRSSPLGTVTFRVSRWQKRWSKTWWLEPASVRVGMLWWRERSVCLCQDAENNYNPMELKKKNCRRWYAGICERQFITYGKFRLCMWSFITISIYMGRDKNWVMNLTWLHKAEEVMLPHVAHVLSGQSLVPFHWYLALR